MLAAESRRLQFVAGGVAVEVEPEPLGGTHQTVEMRVDVDDPVVGIEAHRFDEVGGVLSASHAALFDAPGADRKPYGFRADCTGATRPLIATA